MLRSASARSSWNLARASRARAISLSVRASSISPPAHRLSPRVSQLPHRVSRHLPGDARRPTAKRMRRSHLDDPSAAARTTAPASRSARPVWHGAARGRRTHAGRATPRGPRRDAPREGFRPEGARPGGSLPGLDSVAHSFIVCYGAEARPRRSRGHARTPPFDVHEKQRETCRPRRVSTLPRALVDSSRQPGPRSPVRATHSTRPTWKAPYPQ